MPGFPSRREVWGARPTAHTFLGWPGPSQGERGHGQMCCWEDHTTGPSSCSKGLLNPDVLGPGWIQTLPSPAGVHSHPSQLSSPLPAYDASVRALFHSGELATG